MNEIHTGKIASHFDALLRARDFPGCSGVCATWSEVIEATEAREGFVLDPLTYSGSHFSI